MLQRKFRLCRSAQFEVVFKNGEHYVSKYIVVYVLERNAMKVGFIASKKIGNAIKRNRAKRLMREAIRSCLPYFKKPCHLILIARRPITQASMLDVERSMLHVLRRAGVVNEIR